MTNGYKPHNAPERIPLMKTPDRVLVGLAILALVSCIASVFAQQVTPIPPISTQPISLMTPYCTSVGAASGVWAGSFNQTASSGITANVLTVTDGVKVYNATVNSTTGAVSCFVPQ